MSSSPTSRWRGRTVAVLLAAAVPLAASGSVAQAAPTAQARLASVARKAPNRTVTAIVQFRRGVSERRARALVRSHHGRVTDRLPSINGFAIKLPAREARALRRNKHVLNLTLNTRVHGTGVDAGSLATTYPTTIGAEKLWAAGITGKGVGVAVVDSGINGDMPDFKNADGTPRITASVIANPDATRPGDDIGHGTHVAGIIAGNSFNRDAGDPARGAYVGIAPEANLVAVKTADDHGDSTVLDVITALQFVVDHKDDLNIRVVNLSVSSDTPGSYRDDPLDAAVEFAWHAGIVVVAAGGNRGDAADAVQYAPGNDPYVISVGATDEAGTPDPSDDVTAAFSSRGVTQDGVSKPDLLAPGARIVAPMAMGSAFEALCPQCVVGADYLRIGGTSMSAPVVTGAAALLLQARPELNPDEVKALLVASVTAGGPRLGTADSFAVLAGSTVTNTGPSSINGNLGLQPGTAVTGSAPGTVSQTTYAATATALRAKSDLTSAYNDAARRTPATTVPGDIGGLTLTPGVYRSGSSIGLTGTLTLDAQGDPNAVFVFQAGSTLITASGSRVKLVNGAQACNVFWQVGSSATLGTSTVLAGNILALTSITMNNRVTLNGRALARNGAVTLINDTITAPHCAGELDVSRALPADAGVGANQGVQPNEAVEDALVAAGIDPTRSSWTRSSWTRSSWTRSSWTRSSWTRSSWTDAEPGIVAPWARATWTCDTCASGDSGVEPARLTASASSWSGGAWSGLLQR
ncbi:MAG TPA: ice-binding family protein [Solirubrobacteraceae bacterium]|nr:ice-binding family protein [Solirubrobacteraceae bacterium]